MDGNIQVQGCGGGAGAYLSCHRAGGRLDMKIYTVSYLYSKYDASIFWTKPKMMENIYSFHSWQSPQTLKML